MDADDNKGSGELQWLSTVYMNYMTKMQSITMTDYNYPWSQVKLLLYIEPSFSHGVLKPYPWYFDPLPWNIKPFLIIISVVICDTDIL